MGVRSKLEGRNCSFEQFLSFLERKKFIVRGSLDDFGGDIPTGITAEDHTSN